MGSRQSMVTQRTTIFTSDNGSGVSPEAWHRMQEANKTAPHAPYGGDRFTVQAKHLVKEWLGTDLCTVEFVHTGTAANGLGLQTLCPGFQSIYCHQSAHIETDERGAPHWFTAGAKLRGVAGEDGRIDLDALEQMLRSERVDNHHSQAAVISITQSTECGTVYHERELERLRELRGRYNIRIHMDGARFTNAVVSTGKRPMDLAWMGGVDVLSLGGAKNGLPCSECVVFFDPDLARHFQARLKQHGHWPSKLWLETAAWCGLIESGEILKNARNANAMASLLRGRIYDLPGVDIRYPVEANAVFADLHPQIAQGLKERGWTFYQFIGNGGVRFMCSWQTSQNDVDCLAADIEDLGLEIYPVQRREPADSRRARDSEMTTV